MEDPLPGWVGVTAADFPTVPPLGQQCGPGHREGSCRLGKAHCFSTSFISSPWTSPLLPVPCWPTGKRTGPGAVTQGVSRLAHARGTALPGLCVGAGEEAPALRGLCQRVKMLWQPQGGRRTGPGPRSPGEQRARGAQRQGTRSAGPAAWALTLGGPDAAACTCSPRYPGLGLPGSPRAGPRPGLLRAEASGRRAEGPGWGPDTPAPEPPSEGQELRALTGDTRRVLRPGLSLGWSWDVTCSFPRPRACHTATWHCSVCFDEIWWLLRGFFSCSRQALPHPVEATGHPALPGCRYMLVGTLG